MPRGVRIGKNIIEILTTGMYKDARVIVREFVQNSVDSLEKSLDAGDYSSHTDLPPINVTVDPDKQTLLVADRGMGVPSKDAWDTLTSIAASEKDRGKDLGFRGIGRLAGLAYCRKMIIETSAPGETVKSRLVWDAEKLRTLIHDRSYRVNAVELVEAVTTFTTEEGEGAKDCYYNVLLEGVTDDALLNSESVKDYLAQVAPIPFRSFLFASKIRSTLQEEDVSLNEYRVFVNNDQIFKPYKSYLYEETTKGKRSVSEIVDIRFKRFEVDGKLAGICWYSVCNPLQLIKACNPFGIRLRKGNIEVGDRFSLQALFADVRFHKYFVGELHILDERCVPNGQRDYFEDTPAFREIATQFRAFARELGRLCQQASQASSCLRAIEAFHRESEEFKQREKHGTFLGPEEREEAKEKLAEAEEKAEEAEGNIDRLLAKSDTESEEVLTTLVEKQRKETLERIGKDAGEGPDGEKPKERPKKNPYLTGQLSCLPRRSGNSWDGSMASSRRSFREMLLTS